VFFSFLSFFFLYWDLDSGPCTVLKLCIFCDQCRSLSVYLVLFFRSEYFHVQMYMSSLMLRLHTPELNTGFSHLSFHLTCVGGGSVANPSLLVRQLRHREVKGLAP
jgi:hypothetical protein